MKTNDLRMKVLSVLFGGYAIGLTVATVDALRVIISLDYLFQTVWDKLFLVSVSMLVYIGASVFAALTTLMVVNTLIVSFNVQLNNQKSTGISICIATAASVLPLLVSFYNYRVRYLFPLKEHISDIAIVFALCLIAGILVGYLFSKISGVWKRVSRVMVVAFLLPFAAAVGIHLGTKDASVNKGEGKPNVILIVVDTLRADHLGCYGYHRPTSPNIDAMVKESILFRHAITQAPWTLPSITSLMTSLYPSVHKLHFPPKSVEYSASSLDEARTTLAEYLREEGYKTGAFVGAGGHVSSRFHGQGFDFYDDEIAYSTRYNHLILLNIIGRIFGFYSSRLADTTTEQVQYWLSRNKHLPFFLFIHYWDPHDPYGSPEPFTTRYDEDYDGVLSPGITTAKLEEMVSGLNSDDIAYVASLYDGEISFTDAQIGKLIELLKELKLLDNTMVILTADHGEELFEHGGFGHSKTLYEELIRIPLLIRYPPFGADKTIDSQVQLIDVVPTVLDYLGIDVSDEAQGISLIPLVKCETDNELPAYSETMLKGRIIAIRSGNFKFIKYIENGREELFDLEEDPGELSNLVDSKVEMAEQMRQELFEWMEACKEKAASLPKANQEKVIPIDDKTMEELRSLGYLQ